MTDRKLKHRLGDVIERSMLIQILKDVEENEYKYKDVLEGICDPQSLELFGKFLTAKEYTTRLEPIVLTEDAFTAMIYFAKRITTLKNEPFREVMVVLGWFRAVVEQSLQKTIQRCIKNDGFDSLERIQQFREFAKACVNLPEKITNCHVAARNQEHKQYIKTVSISFKKNLLEAIKNGMIHAHSLQETDADHSILLELVASGRNMHMDDNFSLLKNIITFIGDIPDFDKRWAEITGELFKPSPYHLFSVHEALLTALFLTVTTAEQLKRCIPTRKIEGSLKRVATVKLPFQRELEPWTLKLLLDFVHSNDSTIASRMLETAVKIWSDTNFATTAPEPREKHIVRIILYLTRMIGSDYPDWSYLFTYATTGVHTRLELLPTSIRSALFINFTFANLASEKDAPTVGDVELDDNNDWSDEMQNIYENGIQKPKPTKKKNVPVILDEIPVHKFQPSEAQRQFDSDDDEDDEDFPKYLVDESENQFERIKPGQEPRPRAKRPKYIADAYEQLLEREKYEVFEAAFFALPELVIKKAIGFAEFAEPIVLRIVNLQNTFGTEKFEETVEKIACSSIANRPEIVPNLIRLIIHPGQGERTQQKLLHFIMKAADVMGELNEQQSAFVEEQHKRMEIINPGLIPLKSEDLYDNHARSERLYPARDVMAMSGAGLPTIVPPFQMLSQVDSDDDEDDDDDDDVGHLNDTERRNFEFVQRVRELAQLGREERERAMEQGDVFESDFEPEVIEPQPLVERPPLEIDMNDFVIESVTFPGSNGQPDRVITGEMLQSILQQGPQAMLVRPEDPPRAAEEPEESNVEDLDSESVIGSVEFEGEPPPAVHLPDYFVDIEDSQSAPGASGEQDGNQEESDREDFRVESVTSEPPPITHFDDPFVDVESMSAPEYSGEGPDEGEEEEYFIDENQQGELAFIPKSYVQEGIIVGLTSDTPGPSAELRALLNQELSAYNRNYDDVDITGESSSEDGEVEASNPPILVSERPATPVPELLFVEDVEEEEMEYVPVNPPVLEDELEVHRRVVRENAEADESREKVSYPMNFTQSRSRHPENFRRYVPNASGETWQEFVDARIKSKTRILSRGYQQTEGAENRLGKNAQYMFYPLLVLPRGELARLLGRDSDLLSLIIVVASMVYMRCGLCPSISKMSIELLQYVRPHRFSENIKVRCACMAAYLNVFALLPLELLASLFSSQEIAAWQEWTQLAMTNSSSQVEYNMAHQLGHTIERHLEEQYEQRYVDVE